MIVITIREDGTLEAMVTDPMHRTHIVVIDEKNRWTDSPIQETAPESEMVEWIAAHRYEGYEDRNP